MKRHVIPYLPSLLTLLVGGCNAFRSADCHCGLSQQQVLSAWMRSSKDNIYYKTLSVDQSGDPLLEQSADFLLMPDSVNISKDEIDRYLGQYAGPCLQLMWCYEMPKEKMKCYVNSCISPAFPVSSKGLDISISLLNDFNIEVEDIYLLNDSTVTTYSPDEFHAAGWTSTCPRTFSFNIPANDSGSERLWAVEVYAKHRSFYDDRVRHPWNVDPSQLKNKKHPVANLYFIQVTDSVTPAMIYERNTRRFLHKIPNTTKWLRDPEGGYPEDDM